MCVNEILHSHGTGQKELLVACELRPLLIVLFMGESELEHSVVEVELEYSEDL